MQGLTWIQAARRVEDDVAYIAKTVAENYDDEELRTFFVGVTIDLYVACPVATRVNNN